MNKQFLLFAGDDYYQEVGLMILKALLKQKKML